MNLKYTSFFILILAALLLAGCNMPLPSDTDTAPAPPGVPDEDFFPVLSDPGESTRPGGGGGGGEDQRSMGFDLVSELPLEEIYQYYAIQLTAAGWEKTSEKASPEVSFSDWRFQDDTGQNWSATMAISANPLNPESNYFVEINAILTPE